MTSGPCSIILSRDECDVNRVLKSQGTVDFDNYTHDSWNNIYHLQNNSGNA